MKQKLSNLELDIPDLDKLNQEHFKKELLLKKNQFKKQNTIIKTNKIYIKASENASCIYCSSVNIYKHGIRKNKNYRLQRYGCKNCHRSFSFNALGFSRIHVSPETVSQAMEMYFMGISLRGISTFLGKQGIKISHTSVYNWIKKYIKLMKVFLEQFAPKVSDNWRCDEVYIKIKGDPKYLFVLMDDETRFILAYYIADTKKTSPANKLLHMAKMKAGKKPKVFTTDGLLSYKKAFLEEYWSPIESCKHVRVTYADGTKWKNNLMERWNGTFRHREKTFRGLGKKDTPIIDGFILYYNFIRKHTGINAIPSELAGIHIEDNKWITLIQNATVEQRHERMLSE